MLLAVLLSSLAHAGPVPEVARVRATLPRREILVSLVSIPALARVPQILVSCQDLGDASTHRTPAVTMLVDPPTYWRHGTRRLACQRGLPSDAPLVTFSMDPGAEHVEGDCTVMQVGGDLVGVHYDFHRDANDPGYAAHDIVVTTPGA